MSTTNTNPISALSSLQQNLVKLDDKYMTKITTNTDNINALDSKLTELSSAAQVDQTYNPESENAQSGKAIAQAIDDTFNDYIVTKSFVCSGSVNDISQTNKNIEIELSILDELNIFDISKCVSNYYMQFNSIDNSITFLNKETIIDATTIKKALVDFYPHIKSTDKVRITGTYTTNSTVLTPEQSTMRIGLCKDGGFTEQDSKVISLGDFDIELSVGNIDACLFFRPTTVGKHTPTITNLKVIVRFDEAEDFNDAIVYCSGQNNENIILRTVDGSLTKDGNITKKISYYPYFSIYVSRYSSSGEIMFRNALVTIRYICNIGDTIKTINSNLEGLNDVVSEVTTDIAKLINDVDNNFVHRTTKNTKRGNVVSIDDASPIEHNLEIQLISKKEITTEQWDISRASNTDYLNFDKNLNVIHHLDGGDHSTNETLRELCPNLKVGDVVTFSWRLEEIRDLSIFVPYLSSISSGYLSASDCFYITYAITKEGLDQHIRFEGFANTIYDFSIGVFEDIITDFSNVNVQLTVSEKTIEHWDISKATNNHAIIFNVEDDIITLSDAGENNTKETLGELCPNLKAGDTVVLTWYSDAYRYVALFGDATLVSSSNDNGNYHREYILTENSLNRELEITGATGNIENFRITTEAAIQTQTIVNANVDGTVDALKSSPSIMTISTDSEDVLINVTYKTFIDESMPQVDQTYNPNSGNAQSGNAVAQAIKNLSGGSNTKSFMSPGSISITDAKENPYDIKLRIVPLEELELLNTKDLSSNNTITVNKDDNTITFSNSPAGSKIIISDQIQNLFPGTTVIKGDIIEITGTYIKDPSTNISNDDAELQVGLIKSDGTQIGVKNIVVGETFTFSYTAGGAGAAEGCVFFTTYSNLHKPIIKNLKVKLKYSNVMTNFNNVDAYYCSNASNATTIRSANIDSDGWVTTSLVGVSSNISLSVWQNGTNINSARVDVVYDALSDSDIANRAYTDSKFIYYSRQNDGWKYFNIGPLKQAYQKIEYQYVPDGSSIPILECLCPYLFDMSKSVVNITLEVPLGSGDACIGYQFFKNDLDGVMYIKFYSLQGATNAEQFTMDVHISVTELS